MRPLALEIAGLQSFRELRVIDFEPLLCDNLFGIFGPTGSGKSTILDAITLALFGEVKRTKGSSIASAINSVTTECTVSFRFEINANGERERYLVERSYKLRKSGMKSNARLIRESDDPPTPLADKASEVAEELNKIIGINYDDFSHAVVLPQGAFAEFLRMGGSDRGKMLQRIFGLEELGTHVNSRLKERRRKYDIEREGLEERLTILSEYNDEILAARREEFQEAEKEVKASRKIAEETEKELKESEQIYELNLERNQLVGDEEGRARERADLEGLRSRLKSAERALELEAIIERVKDAEKRSQNASENYEQAKKEKEKAEEDVKRLTGRKQKADEWRENELPQSEDELDALKNVAEADNRITALDGSLKEREKKISELEQTKKENQQRLEKAAEKEKSVGEEREKLQQEIKSLDKTVEDLINYSHFFEKLERLVCVRDEKEQGLRKRTQEENEIHERLKELKTDLENCREEEKKRTLHRDKAEREFENARQNNALGEISSLLKEGEPCPLCGAIDHPHPHKHAERGDLTKLKEHLDAAEKELKNTTDRLHSCENKEANLMASVEDARKRREELETDFQSAVEEVTQMVAETEWYRRETDSLTVQKGKKKVKERLEAGKSERKEKNERLAGLESSLSTTGEILMKQNKKQAELEATIRSMEDERDREQKERDAEEKKRRDYLSKTSIAIEVGKAEAELTKRKERLKRLKKKIESIEHDYTTSKEELGKASLKYGESVVLLGEEEKLRDKFRGERDRQFREKGFASLDDWSKAFLSPENREELRVRIQEIRDLQNRREERLREINEKIGDQKITDAELEEKRSKAEGASKRHDTARTAFGKSEGALEDCRRGNHEWKEAQKRSEKSRKEKAALDQLDKYLKGNAFINYLADEQLRSICRTASTQLHLLTRGRLEIDTRTNEGFVVRDFGNGGIERAASSLSGGETFLVSLSLALALSESLQLRGAPLEFFFLDEGFGTLDSDLLETVIDTLDRLRANSRRAIGIISHVESLRERISRKLIISPATAERGSDVRVEG